MGRRLVILTVGTSLTENDGGPGRSRDTDVASLNKECKQAQDCDDAQAVLCRLKPFLTPEGLCSELRFLTSLHRQSNHKAKQAGHDHQLMYNRLSQELTYLALLAEKRQEVSCFEVALLASDSPRGKLCAEVLKKVLEDPNRTEPWSRFCLLMASSEQPCVVKGLKVHGNDEVEENQIDRIFRTQGIPKLITELQQLYCLAPWEEVLLNFTGGFKGAIPYTTMAEAFLKPHPDRQDSPPPVSLHYLFEETDQFLSLPVYPVGLDFPLYHQQRRLLEAYQTHPDLFREALHPRILALAKEHKAASDEKKSAPEECGKLTSVPCGSLPRLLEDRYQDQLKRDPLQVYSASVIRQFLPQDEDLRKPLLHLVTEVGDRIWHGDKLPMAADHASKHHHNLLEIAQLLLTPLANQKIPRPPARDGSAPSTASRAGSGDGGQPQLDDPEGQPCFLTPEERFVLLAAVLLHDCGHVLDALPYRPPATETPSAVGVGDGSGASEYGAGLVPLFTSEVREYHHFLAYHRLTTPELAKELGWNPPKKPEGDGEAAPHADGGSAVGPPAWSDRARALAPAVAWLCLYHRRRVGWDGHLKDSPECRAAQRGKTFCPYLELLVPEPKTLWDDRRQRQHVLSEEWASRVDLPKLVALMRLIDGCDNQSRRVGQRRDSEAVRQGLARDRLTWVVQLQSLLPLALQAWKLPATKPAAPAGPEPESCPLPEEPCRAAACGLLRRLRDTLEGKATGEADQALQAARDLSAMEWQTRVEFGRELAAGRGDTAARERRLLWLQVARCYDEIRLRCRQDLHLLKHEAIRWITVLPGQGHGPKEDGRQELWHLRVCLYPDRERGDLETSAGVLRIDDPKVCQQFRADMGQRKLEDGTTQPFESVRQWILQEISTEVTPASLAYLERVTGRRVRVSFEWEDGKPGVFVDSQEGVKEIPASERTSSAGPEEAGG